MDSHPTGSKDILLNVETHENILSVTIKGKSMHPIFTEEDPSDCNSSVKVSCAEQASVYIKEDNSIVSPMSLTKNWHYATEHKLTEPLFYEQQTYEIIIEVAEGHTAKFWHENQSIREKVTTINKKQTLLTGVINFHNEIGLSNLQIYLDGIPTPYLEIIIEVFPSKISYKEDYKVILADITKEVYNLVFDFFKKTYSSYQIGETSGNSLVEFFSILQHIYNDFIKAADRILSHPHHQLEITHEVAPAHKIKRTDNQTLHWIEMHPDQAKKKNGKVYAERALSVKKRITYNTNENRLAKHMLLMTIKRLDDFKNKYNLLEREKDFVVIEQIDEMIKQLKWRCNTSFMAEVESFGNTSGMSLVFSMAPGYKELYKFYIMLQRGLSISGDIFNISQKDLALLYEYWCFIKLNSILRDHYELGYQDILKTRGDGLFVSLTQGKQSKVKYKNPKNGEDIILTYNPEIENEIPTVAQKPDNVLELKKEGSHTYKYVFDSKYKISTTKNADGSISILGPEEADINTMHRYRDAIVASVSDYHYERSMFGAYVLFPSHDETAYQEHAFYRSIEKVNIGGLPFLPGSTDLVTELLDDLILDSPDTAFERTTLPLGIEERLAKTDWSVRDVMIAPIYDFEQWENFRKSNCYYVPESKISKSAFPIHYIAILNLFDNGKGIQYFGEVTKCIPNQYDSANFGKKYYRFEIKRWVNLGSTIHASKSNAKISKAKIDYTNKFLLEHCTEIDELQIQSEAEYRFYREIKRVANNITINKDHVGIYFICDNIDINFKDGNINALQDGNKIDSWEIGTFLKEPGPTFRCLQHRLQSYNTKANIGDQ